MTKTRAVWAILCLAGVVTATGAGCSDEGNGGAGGSGGAGVGGTGGGGSSIAGSSGGSNAGGGAGSATCPVIANVGTAITQVAGTGAAPQAAGGTIVDGTYVLTKEELFPPQSTSVLAHKTMTLVIAAPQIGIANDADDAPAPYTMGGTFMTAGTTLTISWQCGPGAGLTFAPKYTATSTQLVVIDDGRISTFAKR